MVLNEATDMLQSQVFWERILTPPTLLAIHGGIFSDAVHVSVHLVS